MPVAGQNKILEEGTVLFHEGEQSDGMYVVRKGEILVYLEKGGNEIPLATVGSGAMIGEMALFDKKPRSASARSLEKCEVTVISNADFAKIMKQIPKWFVSLMSALSSRLRETNSRLEDLEAEYKSNVSPLEELTKALNIIHLLWFKIGSKEGKNWSMTAEDVHNTTSSILSQAPARIQQICQAMTKVALMGEDKDSYNKDIYTTQNRGNLERFVNFITTVKNKDPMLKEFPQGIVDLLTVIENIISESAYETMSISLEQAEAEALTMGISLDSSLAKCIKLLKDLDDSVEVTIKDNQNITFKINKKNFAQLKRNASSLRTLSKYTTKAAPPAKKAQKKKPSAA